MKNLARKLILPLTVVMAFGSFNPAYSGEPVKEKNKYENMFTKDRIIKLDKPISKAGMLGFYVGELKKGGIKSTAKLIRLYDLNMQKLNLGAKINRVYDINGNGEADKLVGKELIKYLGRGK